MTRVKICGVTNAADRDAAIGAGVDAVGVVSGVPVDTPREVAIDAAADLLSDVPPFGTGVLVTMPETVDRAVERVERTAPDAIQIHDSDRLGGPAAIERLGDRVACDVVAGVDASDLLADGAADPTTVDGYAAVSDALLVDSTDAAGGGGTGRTHDWAATADLRKRIDRPLVLAGGLRPDNVAAAVDAVDPYAVDVSTGVEADPGHKDHAAVRSFVGAARAAAPRGTRP